MPSGGDFGKLEHLVHGYLRGRLGRREFVRGGLQLGLSVAVLARLMAPARAASLMDSASAAPYESPITQERIDFLKTKPFKGTTINVMVPKAPPGDGLKIHVPHWEEETGGKINVAEVPDATLHQQIFSDLASGLNRYDAYMTGAWFYGDFFVPETPYIVEIGKFLSDPRYPYWDPNQWLPSVRKLYEWKGKLYGVLFDADAQALYYRKDIFADEQNKKKFKAKHGYDLPSPPRTMNELHDAAQFFTGWDWNKDGGEGWGLALHAKVNEQGFFHFLTLSAPYVVSLENRYYFFHPQNMKPLINSEGHLKALEDYVKLASVGPREEISWTMGQGWNLFLAGRSAMEPTWGDLPTLAQDPKTSKVKGRIGAAGIPGTTAAFNPITGQWKKYDLNQVGNANGGSWHCVISRKSKKPEATYDFLAFMANRKNAFFNCTHGGTGVQPGMKFEYLPPVGTANLQEFAAQKWNTDDVVEYLKAYYSVLSAPVQENYLRIPGTAEYWHELDVNISAVLGGQMHPKAALDTTAAAWESITERYGREKQKALYEASFA